MTISISNTSFVERHELMVLCALRASITHVTVRGGAIVAAAMSLY
jgi:hypothetical protein